jgi:hypothetical protein
MPANAITTIGVSNSRSHHFRRRKDFFFEPVPAFFAERLDAGPVDAAARPEAVLRFGACRGA